MSEHWKDTLVNRFPHLYKNTSILQFNKGWLQLIQTLSAEINNHLDQKNNNLPPNTSPLKINISQVKEKFGGLRFYYSGGDNTISGMVKLTESLSYITCENCGSPGKTRNDNWIRTLCDICQENRARK